MIFASLSIELGNLGSPDIAIGSPYEANGDTGNTGGVYIYYGKSSVDGLLSTNPDQVSPPIVKTPLV
jgi:hypothetical protein